MRGYLRLFVLGFSLLLLWVPAAVAQITGKGPAVTRNVSLKDLEDMKKALLDLVFAQEEHWEEKGTYTTDLVALKLFNKDASKPRVVVVFAGGRSWHAESGYPPFAKTCVVFVGETSDFAKPPVTKGDRTSPRREGMPVCDGL